MSNEFSCGMKPLIRQIYTLVCVAVPFLLSATASYSLSESSRDVEEVDLSVLAQRFCLDADGDHELTWAIAVHDGYNRLDPGDFPDLQTPGARRLRGFSKMMEQTEVRVLTAVNRIRLGDDIAYFHLCWVSANPADRSVVDANFKQLMKIPRFRQKNAFVYAWLAEDDGSMRAVRRSVFESRWISLARQRGMRMAFTNAEDVRVSITYMRPVESCEDWCY